MNHKPRKTILQGGMWLVWIGFIILILFLGKGLSLNPNLLPSQMIDKPFPDFNLKSIDSNKMIQMQDIMGKPGLVHVWATWCGVCLHEHESLMAIQQKWHPDIYSVSYKDQPNRVLQWLADNGDPYRMHLNDNLGKLALDLGVYGTPETYVVDAKGMIRFRHVGPLDMKLFEKKMLPLLNDS